MDRLVAEGLLERIETGGCRVATFTPDDIADAIELRGVVEGTAKERQAPRRANLRVVPPSPHPFQECLKFVLRNIIGPTLPRCLAVVVRWASS